MIVSDSDSHTGGLTAALAGLAVAPSARFSDRIFSQWVRVAGPVGPLFVAFTDQGISYVRPTSGFGDRPEDFALECSRRFDRPVRPADRPPAGLTSALRRGHSRELRFDLRGLSDFEQAVLRAALAIPRGQTRPYSWVAREIGHPAAVRAAGSALGRNPVPILIPCHRVVRSDGAPGNYIFGPETKQRLLASEDVDLHEVRRLTAAGVHYLASDTTGIFCYPTCANARRITPPHRVELRSVAAATGAGYRPCLACRPAGAQSA